jgi:hypothetical protein
MPSENFKPIDWDKIPRGKFDDDILKAMEDYRNELIRQMTLGQYSDARTASPEVDKPIKPETLQDLYRSLREIRGQVVTEMWFVDRQRDYFKIREYCKQYAVSEDYTSLSYDQVYGVRLYEINTKLPMSDSVPWYGRMPGIWLVYADGKVEPYVQ